LERFLTRFVELTSQISTGMLAQSTDADEKEVIAALSKPFNEQVTRLCDHVRQSSKTFSRQSVEQVGIVLRLNAADALLDSGTRVAQNLSSTTAKLGLSDIFDLIKKILKKLFPNLPAWLNAILELLNELKNAIFGAGSPKLANTLSQRHQNYLAELTHLERLDRESAWRMANEQDEE
jgi:hypothetical protein